MRDQQALTHIRCVLDEGAYVAVEAIPIYVEELLLLLTCYVEGTSGDDSGSWSRAVILYKR